MTGTRAMTLLELLLALALLAGLVAATTSWTRLAGTSGAHLAEPLRWERGAAAVLDLVQGDLVTGDFDSAPDAPPRVRVRANAVEIDTRAPGRGTTTHTYRRDDRARTLVRAAPGGDRGADRIILDEVASFECVLDDEAGELTVVIVRRVRTGRPDGAAPTKVERRYRVR